jgi:positive regulator of sigma E activity
LSRPPDKRDGAALGYLAGFFGAGLLLISGGGFWFLIRYGRTISYRGEYQSVG